MDGWMDGWVGGWMDGWMIRDVGVQRIPHPPHSPSRPRICERFSRVKNTSVDMPQGDTHTHTQGNKTGAHGSVKKRRRQNSRRTQNAPNVTTLWMKIMSEEGHTNGKH